MKNLNDIIEIYNKALSIDYSIYNSEIDSEFNEEVKSLIPQFKTDSTDPKLNQVAEMLMMFYFLHLTKNGGTFCNDRLIKENIGRDLTEMGCSPDEQPFYNIARTYWTLKVLVFYDIFPTDNEELRSSIAVRALQQTELTLSTYFFPSMGGAGFSHSERQKKYKVRII